MAKEVKLPQEIETVAEKVIDLGLTAMRANYMFRYAVLRSAEKRAGGNQSKAAKQLGMTRQNFNQAKELLEARLS
jgi:transcriptional regulator with GAF, ATPase, and Fis domain